MSMSRGSGLCGTDGEFDFGPHGPIDDQKELVHLLTGNLFLGSNNRSANNSMVAQPEQSEAHSRSIRLRDVLDWYDDNRILAVVDSSSRERSSATIFVIPENALGKPLAVESVTHIVWVKASPTNSGDQFSLYTGDGELVAYAEERIIKDSEAFELLELWKEHLKAKNKILAEIITRGELFDDSSNA